MKLTRQSPKQSLNKAYLKQRPLRSQMDLFKTGLIGLLDKIDEKESEEFHKNLVSDFLKKTIYQDEYFINTKGRQDLVIHNGKDNKSQVGVILEAKRPNNKADWFTRDKPNGKAIHELVLYYLRERIEANNIDLKYLVATNINEWYIIEASYFEKLFYKNKTFVKHYEEWRDGQKVTKDTGLFYNDIVKPFIDDLNEEIPCTYFNIHDYEKVLRNADQEDDKNLIALLKILSPNHLLKVPFANDSNSLDKRFYSELLHIIGLTEVKEGGKKLIERNKPVERHSGTLLESAIVQLDSLDKLSRLDRPSQFGNSREEQYFNIGLELCITWINRILFLKLMEAQLIAYHKGDKSYTFLKTEKIKNYDDLNSLFFQVLARQFKDRNEDVKKLFEKVPYLNSSLFEPTDLEQITLFISNLKDDREIPVYSQTVLKDKTGKKRTGGITALEYLFEFLNAYDFSGEGSEEVQEDNKTLINASVLGLIFEKINGYKDGSFFTPGFITMYMCREAIRKAVVQKFNERKKWNVERFEELYDNIEDRNEANEIVNSLKICDPAVGSGHFLVSALNEIISVKNDLKILTDRTGKRLKEYHVEVVNDELVVTDEEGDLFEYNPSNQESQRIQETLFHEKETIIEKCLFGVDINSNSVKICRLRLWIELLKSAYYKNSTELETLPNIDINIKCGNSLVSRFAIDADIKKALSKSKKWSISSYRAAVDTYRNAENKEQKHEMEKLINDIKSDFKSNIDNPFKRKVSEAKGKIDNLASEINTEKQWGNKPNKKLIQEFEKAVEKLKKLEEEKETIESNKIYESAFEWRFEFPEVLNDDGDFLGFDAVIGNPPYFSLSILENEMQYYFSNSNFKTFAKGSDIYCLFYELGMNILNDKSIICFITSNRFCFTNYGVDLRKYLSAKNILQIINFNDVNVFENANVGSLMMLVAKNTTTEGEIQLLDFKESSFLKPIEELMIEKSKLLSKDYFNENQWSFDENIIQKIKFKIESKGISFSKWKGIAINRGVTTGANKIFIIDTITKEKICNEDPNSTEIIKPILRGKDIKRYSLTWSGDWIIFTKRGIDIDKYPAIKNYLLPFRNELEPGVGRKVGKYKWFEIQDITAFYTEFDKKKLIWTRLSKINGFSISENKEFCLDSASFAVTKDAEYLSAILNSKVVLFYFKLGSVIWGKDGIKWFGNYFDNIPIPAISEEEQKPFIILVDQILKKKSLDNFADTFDLENQIDRLVYKLYDLTDEEIKIIEDSES